MFGNEESNAMRDFYHLVIVSDVVVDPHSPARVNLGCRFSKWLKIKQFFNDSGLESFKRTILLCRRGQLHLMQFVI